MFFKFNRSDITIELYYLIVFSYRFDFIDRFKLVYPRRLYLYYSYYILILFHKYFKGNLWIIILIL